MKTSLKPLFKTPSSYFRTMSQINFEPSAKIEPKKTSLERKVEAALNRNESGALPIGN